MNLLTVRKLPIHDWNRSGSETKWRLDANLVRLIHDSIQLAHPGVKIGKRFAIEYALLNFLADRGLITDAPSLPNTLCLSDRIVGGVSPEGPVAVKPNIKDPPLVRKPR